MIRLIHRIGVRLTHVAQRVVPDPFVLALGLSAVVMVAGFVHLLGQGESARYAGWAVLTGWAGGFAETGLLAFALQMALVLVTGHAVAASDAVQRGVAAIARMPSSSASAAACVAVVSCAAALVHWGLGVTVGAFVAREMARAAEADGRRFDYPLLGAAAYVGLAVWHGGLSGSAPLAVAAEGNAFAASLGSEIPVSDTLFGALNLAVTATLVIAITTLFWMMAPRDDVGPERTLGAVLARTPGTVPKSSDPEPDELDAEQGSIAQRLQDTPLIGVGVGCFGLLGLAAGFVTDALQLDLPSVILVFLFLGMALQRSVSAYVDAVADAARGAGAILLQFPFYFALVGVMKASDLVSVLSDALASVATVDTFPVFAFLAAGLVNFFVPSGGGQWAMQGDILGGAGAELGVAPEITVMAFAYGDAWTNMLQPFWALPILAITGLRARDIMGWAAMVFLMMGVLVPVLLLVLT